MERARQVVGCLVGVFAIWGPWRGALILYEVWMLFGLEGMGEEN